MSENGIRREDGGQEAATEEKKENTATETVAAAEEKKENTAAEGKKENTATEAEAAENNVVAKKKKPVLPLVIGAVVLLAVLVAVALIVYSNMPAQRLKRQLALAERYLGELDYQQAVAAYKAALEIDPADPEAAEGLYQTYLAWGKSLTGDEAVRVYEEAIKAYPDRPEAYMALLAVYADRGDTEAMLQLYERAAAALSDENAVLFKEQLIAAFLKLIDAKLADGDTDGALKLIELLEKIDAAKAAELRRKVIDAILMAGTEESCYRVLELDPKSEEAYLKLIELNLEKKEYGKVQKLIRDGEAATGSSKIGEQKKELPYVMVNDIEMEEEFVRECTYDDYKFLVTDEAGRRHDFPGVSYEKGNNTLTISEITEEPAENGMKVIRILTVSKMSPYFSSDNTEQFRMNWYLHAISLFDYYSGKYYNGKTSFGDDSYTVHTVITWKDQSYDITKESSVTWDDDWDVKYDGFMGPWKGHFNAVCYYTYTLTVPSDYDGLVMAFTRTSGDCEVPDDYFVKEVKSKREEESNKWAEEEHYLLDPESDGDVLDPANYYFIRLTDEAIAEFNAGN